jgi:hypothetical protein
MKSSGYNYGVDECARDKAQHSLNLQAGRIAAKETPQPPITDAGRACGSVMRER